jgi:hypothetical protein
VSETLHHWIDLIFGVNQRSFEADNIFYPLTYPDFDVNSADEEIRESIKKQIRDFGQVEKLFFFFFSILIFLSSRHQSNYSKSLIQNEER